MGEEFLGGVCGGKWWNPPQNLFSSGGASGWSSLSSVAQLGGGGGSDVCSFGWPNEAVKGKPNIIHNFEKNNSSVFDESSIIFPADMDSTFDSIFSFNSSPTDCHQINLLGKDGGNDGNFSPILQVDMNPGLCYGLRTNSSSPTLIMSSNNYSNNNNSCSQDGSPPMGLTASSNNSSASGDSSTITGEGGGLNPAFDPMSSSASYLIQTLFNDTDDSQLMKPNYNELMSPSCSWVTTSINNCPPSIHPSHPTLMQSNDNQLVDGGMNMLINGGQGSNGYVNAANLSSNIEASLLNSFNLQSRSRAPSSNQHRSNASCANHGSKVNNIPVRDSKKNVTEQAPVNKRHRIETPPPLPTFKVRKEKLGDRITALQQLVSPFGKTDTASVLHEAIEYIKFLHDQVNALCTPYLKNGAAIQQQQQGYEKSNNDEAKQDLRSRGLCLVPISSTYPVAQETPVDFWTPTFGGATLR